MKAQVLRNTLVVDDPEMKEGIWVANEEMPDPKIEKASDVIVKIGGITAGVCRTDLHIIVGYLRIWKHIQDPDGKTLLPCVMGQKILKTTNCRLD